MYLFFFKEDIERKEGGVGYEYRRKKDRNKSVQGLN
jgi:hypothetical protein